MIERNISIGGINPLATMQSLGINISSDNGIETDEMVESDEEDMESEVNPLVSFEIGGI